MESIIVFSHLRWDFVFQRPQHLMTRLARSCQVYFFEEPVYAEGPARLEISEPFQNLHVVRPYTPVSTVGFSDSQLPELRRLLEQLVKTRNIRKSVVWMYTPMALPL